MAGDLPPGEKVLGQPDLNSHRERRKGREGKE
jgi:hypothetical protein